MLTRASPVFKSMLEPRFREGLMLAADSTVEIPLPDEDHASMELLCNIIHLRQDSISELIQPATILALAALCDKYACVHVAKALLELWITN